jgi:hypothetical protein
LRLNMILKIIVDRLSKVRNLVERRAKPRIDPLPPGLDSRSHTPSISLPE